MLSAIAGRRPAAATAKLIFALTEGNPYFVEEMVRHLMEEGHLLDSQGIWKLGPQVDQVELPKTIRLVLVRRLERLSENCLRVLWLGAVIGRSFELSLIEELEPAGSADILAALEQAELANLVSPEPGGREVQYRFAHELVRQTLAERLSLPRRQRLH